jgi:hypothetical protein
MGGKSGGWKPLTEGGRIPEVVLATLQSAVQASQTSRKKMHRPAS